MNVHAPEAPNIFSPEHTANPWPGYEILRDHHPIHWDDATQSTMFSRYEHVRPLLMDHKRFSTEHMHDQLSAALGEARTLVSMDGAEHTSHRRLSSPFLFGSGLDAFTDTITQTCAGLIDPLFERERAAVTAGERGRAAFDWVRDFSEVYPCDVVSAMMNLPETDFEQLRTWYNQFMDFVANIQQLPEPMELGLKAKQEWGEYVLPLIDERRANPRQGDLISLLCDAEFGGVRMTDQEIRSFLALMLLGGGETVDHQSAQLMYTLAQNPAAYEALRADRSLMDKVLAEGMRYCAIVQFIQRTAREDIEVDGHVIRSGAKITMLLASANRDPRRWEEADTFDIERTDLNVAQAFTGAADHTGFGGGRHQCMGTKLARRELEIALEKVLDNMSDVRLAEDFRPAYTGLFVRSLPSLPLTYTPV